MRFFRAPTAPERALRSCALSTLTVGIKAARQAPSGQLVVAFDDGSAISTLVNPQRDLDDARTACDVTVDDVLPSPILAEVWFAIAPLLDGCVPVGWISRHTLAH